MIVDLRIYTTLPNRLPEFVALYEEKAWPLQLRYLENCLGWYTTVEGELNTVVHMWGYADQGDRERRRAAMAGLGGVSEGGRDARAPHQDAEPDRQADGLLRAAQGRRYPSSLSTSPAR
jgi:hypothetical protein